MTTTCTTMCTQLSKTWKTTQRLTVEAAPNLSFEVNEVENAQTLFIIYLQALPLIAIHAMPTTIEGLEGREPLYISTAAPVMRVPASHERA
mmetsp:Transcript_28004/g.71558  ORF Transcript_28004/g.71558 Transcript_28004/m.71558 type:complete len:91 (-) Transcript_28004:492-764(-)